MPQLPRLELKPENRCLVFFQQLRRIRAWARPDWHSWSRDDDLTSQSQFACGYAE